jgi:hypothetical protein
MVIGLVLLCLELVRGTIAAFVGRKQAHERQALQGTL